MKCPKCQFDNPESTRFCGNCASPLQPERSVQVSHTRSLETPVEDLTRGTTFAKRYEIIEELGKGGMGNVYRVEDTEIHEEVALKLIKSEISADKKTIERFQNELKFARKISHRNICRMYDLNKNKGNYFITIEYFPGEDLKSMIRMSKRMSVVSAIDISKQVCEGLSQAHREGVIHRDLKPSNIMIDREGRARIMDFGIARSLKAKGITEARVMIGTPEYMSPEQVEGKEVDQRSDIYSLGVIRYEMVTGQVPFEGGTPFTVGVKKIFIPVFIFAAVVIIGVIIWQVLPKKTPTPIPTDKPSLAVMYFENNTGDVGLEHYRKALSDLLIADLSQSKYLRVLRGDSLYNILNRMDQLEAKSYSSEVLKEVAE